MVNGKGGGGLNYMTCDVTIPMFVFYHNRLLYKLCITITLYRPADWKQTGFSTLTERNIHVQTIQIMKVFGTERLLLNTIQLLAYVTSPRPYYQWAESKGLGGRGHRF